MMSYIFSSIFSQEPSEEEVIQEPVFGVGTRLEEYEVGEEIV